MSTSITPEDALSLVAANSVASGGWSLVKGIGSFIASCNESDSINPWKRAVALTTSLGCLGIAEAAMHYTKKDNLLPTSLKKLVTGGFIAWNVGRFIKLICAPKTNHHMASSTGLRMHITKCAEKLEALQKDHDNKNPTALQDNNVGIATKALIDEVKELLSKINGAKTDKKVLLAVIDDRLNHSTDSTLNVSDLKKFLLAGVQKLIDECGSNPTEDAKVNFNNLCENVRNTLNAEFGYKEVDEKFQTHSLLKILQHKVNSLTRPLNRYRWSKDFGLWRHKSAIDKEQEGSKSADFKEAAEGLKKRIEKIGVPTTVWQPDRRGGFVDSNNQPVSVVRSKPPATTGV